MLKPLRIHYLGVFEISTSVNPDSGRGPISGTKRSTQASTARQSGGEIQRQASCLSARLQAVNCIVVKENQDATGT